MARITNKESFEFKGFLIEPNYLRYNDPFQHGYIDRYIIRDNVDYKVIGHVARKSDVREFVLNVINKRQFKSETPDFSPSGESSRNF